MNSCVPAVRSRSRNSRPAFCSFVVFADSRISLPRWKYAIHHEAEFLRRKSRPWPRMASVLPGVAGDTRRSPCGSARGSWCAGRAPAAGAANACPRQGQWSWSASEVPPSPRPMPAAALSVSAPERSEAYTDTGILWDLSSTTVRRAVLQPPRKTGGIEAHGASHPAGEGQSLGVPVEPVDREVEPNGGFADVQERLGGAARPGRRAAAGGEAPRGCPALQGSEVVRPCRQVLGGHRIEGLKRHAPGELCRVHHAP